MFSGSFSGSEDVDGRMLTTQNEGAAAHKLGRPVAHLRQGENVRFRGYYWRGSSAPGRPLRQHMVDAVYDVQCEGEAGEVGIRSWFGSRGTHALDNSWGSGLLVAIHATDFLHSVGLVPSELARQLTEHALREVADGDDLTVIAVGDVRCELQFEQGAVISIASTPATLRFADRHIELFVTAPRDD